MARGRHIWGGKKHHHDLLQRKRLLEEDGSWFTKRLAEWDAVMGAENKKKMRRICAKQKCAACKSKHAYAIAPLFDKTMPLCEACLERCKKYGNPYAELLQERFTTQDDWRWLAISVGVAKMHPITVARTMNTDIVLIDAATKYLKFLVKQHGYKNLSQFAEGLLKDELISRNPPRKYGEHVRIGLDRD